MMRANNMMSHMPPTTWTCYTADGAEAAGNSNISSGQAVSSVDLYMIDPGNDDHHRPPALDPVELARAPSASEAPTARRACGR